MNKRFKSFGIAAVSIIGTALVGALVSNEFQALITNFGVSAALVSAIALAVAEGWKAYLNTRTLAKGLATGGFDLY